MKSRNGCLSINIALFDHYLSKKSKQLVIVSIKGVMHKNKAGIEGKIKHLSSVTEYLKTEFCGLTSSK